MHCPRCSTDLKPTNLDLKEYGVVVIDICPDCKGSWCDKGELDQLDDSTRTNVENIEFRAHGESDHNLKCPSCDSNLEAVTPKDTDKVVVDRCPNCAGFWLDVGELEKMQDVAHNRTILKMWFGK